MSMSTDSTDRPLRRFSPVPELVDSDMVGTIIAVFLALAAAAFVTGCNAEGCCNDCSRNYRLDESSGLGGVFIEGGTSGGECEIGDKPYTYDRGNHWVSATIEDRSSHSAQGETYYQYRLDSVDLHSFESPPPECDDRSTFESPDSLISEEVDEESDICVRGEVVVETVCTAKGCPTT